MFADARRHEIKFLQETSVTFTFRSNFQLSIEEKKRFVRMNYEGKRFNCFYSSRVVYKKYYRWKLRIEKLRWQQFLFHNVTSYLKRETFLHWEKFSWKNIIEKLRNEKPRFLRRFSTITINNNFYFFHNITSKISTLRLGKFSWQNIIENWKAAILSSFFDDQQPITQFLFRNITSCLKREKFLKFWEKFYINDFKKKKKSAKRLFCRAANLPEEETIFRNDEQTKHPITLFDLKRDTFLSRIVNGNNPGDWARLFTYKTGKLTSLSCKTDK